MSFAKAAITRALRTAAQTAVGLVPTTAVTLGDVNWQVVGSGAALSGILALLMAFAGGLPEVKTAEPVGDEQ